MSAKKERVPTTVALIHAFNWIDAVLTLVWLARGVEEINPLMDWAHHYSPGLFVVLKLVLISVGVEVIRRHAEPEVSRWVLAGVCLIFASVVAWQFAGALIVAFGT